MVHVGTGSSFVSSSQGTKQILYLNWRGGSDTADTATLPNAVKFGGHEEAAVTRILLHVLLLSGGEGKSGIVRVSGPYLAMNVTLLPVR